jgi:MerR family transcriptional regulator, mercuric resistance operon regulatory protein
MSATVSIGEVSRQSGLSVHTIRYYERIGLLDEPARSDSGRRVYTPDLIDQLLFVRRTKVLGLSLDEIRGLRGVASGGDCGPLRSEVANLIDEKLQWFDERIDELRDLRDGLAGRRDSMAAQGHAADCDCASFGATCECIPVTLAELELVPRERRSADV